MSLWDYSFPLPIIGQIWKDEVVAQRTWGPAALKSPEQLGAVKPAYLHPQDCWDCVHWLSAPWIHWFSWLIATSHVCGGYIHLLPMIWEERS